MYKKGKLTNLALLSVFTVGFAQSSTASATVDVDNTTAATKVSKSKNDDISEASGGVKTKKSHHFVSLPENGEKISLTNEDKEALQDGVISAGKGVGLAVGGFAILSGSILGANEVAKLIKIKKGKQLPPENSDDPSKNSEQQSSDNPGTDSGRKQENKGIGKFNQSGKNLSSYLILSGIVLIIIVIVVLVICLSKSKNKMNSRHFGTTTDGENINTDKFYYNGYKRKQLARPTKDSNIKKIKSILEINYELDSLFNSNEFDNDAAETVLYILESECLDCSKMVFEEIVKKGYFAKQEIADGFAFLLNGEVCGNARISIDQLFYFYFASSDLALSNYINLISESCYPGTDVRVALTGLKMFLVECNNYYNARTNFGCVLQRSSDVTTIHNLVRIFSRIGSTKDLVKIKLLAKRFAKVLGNGNLDLGSFLKVIGKKNFDLDKFILGLNANKFKSDSFLTNFKLRFDSHNQDKCIL